MTNLVKALSPINGNAQHFELSGSSESIILLLARNNEEQSTLPLHHHIRVRSLRHLQYHKSQVEL